MLKYTSANFATDITNFKIFCVMELTMNQANTMLGNGNLGWNISSASCWNLPDFGIQKILSDFKVSILHAMHHSFDYKGVATTREVIIFAVFTILMQVILVPAETYTTFHANISMVIAAALTDVVTCILPAIALITRWMRSTF